MSSFQGKSKALLPQGFEDLLPPLAGQEARSISSLLDHFQKFGYERIKPPLLEFEDSLLAPGPGAALQDQTFRVMDPVSHRMLGLRPDITAQIARIASSRLEQFQRPLRLMYANDALRTKPSQGRPVRQFCQVGFELIGCNEVSADIEVCFVAVDALRSLGVKKITLDLSVPKFVDAVLNAFDIDLDDQKRIRESLSLRDEEAIHAVEPAGLADILKSLLAVYDDAEQAVKVLQDCAPSSDSKGIVSNLAAVVGALREAFSQTGLDDVFISIDACEYRGFEYHDGVCFSLFAEGAAHEVGRGGRYHVQSIYDQSRESATGFTFYIESLRDILVPSDQAKIVYVDDAQSWGTVRELQDQGWIVVRGLGQDGKPDYIRHVYRNGTITEE